MDLKILFEDNHIIVCVKKPGILSQAGDLDMPDMLTLIKGYIKDRYQKTGNVYLGLVHRLDLNVGGVMVFARTSKAAKRLSQQIREHQFNKNYLAVVRGDAGLINHSIHLDNFIKKDQKQRKAIITSNPNEKNAKLNYQVIEKVELEKEVLSLVDIELLTGRFHQIRAQFGYLNLPLYGDNKYGPKTKGYDLGLYAYQLTFEHPTLKETMTFMDYPTTGIFNVFKTLNGGKNHE